MLKNKLNIKKDMLEKNIKNPIYYSFQCLKKHKKAIPIIIIDIIFSSLFAFIPSYIMKNIIFHVSTTTSYELLVSNTKLYLIFYFVFFLLSIIVFRLWDYIIAVKTFPQIKKEIVVENFSYLLLQSKDYFQKNFSGEIAEKIDDLKDGVIDIIKLISGKLIIHTLSIVITCGGLLYYNKPCGLVILGWISFFIIIAKIYGNKISQIAAEWANDSSLLNGIIVDILGNFLAVKIFNNRKYETLNIEKQCNKIQEKEIKIELFFLYGWLIYTFSFFFVQIISLYIIYQQYKTGTINSS
jgi:ATP-binding cassette subfamily B protein